MRDVALVRDGWRGQRGAGTERALVTEEMVPPDSEACWRGRVDECSGVERCHGGRGAEMEGGSRVYKGKDKHATQILITPISSGRSTGQK